MIKAVKILKNIYLLWESLGHKIFVQSFVLMKPDPVGPIELRPNFPLWTPAPAASMDRCRVWLLTGYCVIPEVSFLSQWVELRDSDLSTVIDALK